jgi:hypothetical protein
MDRLTIRPHHLLCAVCHAAGCGNVPAGDEMVQGLIAAIKDSPTIPMELAVDEDITLVNPREMFEGSLRHDPDVTRRREDFVRRYKDTETCRRLGVRLNTTHPAFEIVKWLFANIESLEDICYWNGPASEQWPECPHARQDSIAKMRVMPQGRGEDLDGMGENIFLPVRTKAELARVKEESAAAVYAADHLYIRSHHLFCIMCVYGSGKVNKRLEDDNLYELFEMMRDHPDIPVTVIEGCCDVCPPCPAYYAPENLCLHSHTRDQFKDLKTFQILGLAPGDTLPARELWALLYDRFPTSAEVCGPYKSCEFAHVWKGCREKSEGYELAREQRLLA